MRKKILRLLSGALATLLIVSVLLPGSVTAAETTEQSDQIKQEMRRIHKQCKKHSGRSSFDGLCGTFTGLQIYYMGITDKVVLHNGNQGYDTYCKQEITSGGYRVRAYPSSKGTLREIINEITKNGTMDAYNLLIGWHTTPSKLGRLYGHSSVVHAIVDGQVYFMESDAAIVGGVTYYEGTPIVCSIDDFCTYYERNRYKFEGVIYFGTKTYAEMCRSYTSNFYAAALSDAELRSEPCLPETDSASTLVSKLTPGQQLTVSAVYKNPLGEYWYRVEAPQAGYIRADFARVRQVLLDDLTLADAQAPTVLTQGTAYSVQGKIQAEKNQIFTVRAQIFTLDGDTPTQILGATQVVEDRDFKLARSDISRGLTFRKLASGRYRYSLAAVVCNYYVADGQLMTQYDTVELWSSNFQVIPENTDSITVTFDAQGGKTDLRQSGLIAGQPLGDLPAAKRNGYVFTGWYTAPEGGEPISPETTVTENFTVYAQWSAVSDLQENWNTAGERWYFYADGVYTTGCIEVDGVLYYFNSADTLGHGWTIWAVPDAAH